MLILNAAFHEIIFDLIRDDSLTIQAFFNHLEYSNLWMLQTFVQKSNQTWNG